MKFEIWKVEHEAGDNPSWYSYSIKSIVSIIILGQVKFSGLFPDINPDDIPMAPKTGIIEIEARMG
jgi:hypothetical protein